MPIPEFDQHGNLPVGNLFAAGDRFSLVHATLAEIHERFVAQFSDSVHRSRIWDGWMRHRSELESVGPHYVTLVDGSFSTSKQEPGDVDLCILLDADEVNRLEAQKQEALRNLLRGPGCKPDYFCDAYGIATYPVSDPRFSWFLEQITYWTRVFGIDRQDRQKSFLLVHERGVL